MEDFLSALVVVALVFLSALGSWWFAQGMRDPSSKGDLKIALGLALWASMVSALIILGMVHS